MANTTNPGVVGVGTELVDLSDESLAPLLRSTNSALSHAVERATEEGKTCTDVSASFNAKF
jgi:hypothetical protein